MIFMITLLILSIMSRNAAYCASRSHQIATTAGQNFLQLRVEVGWRVQNVIGMGV